MPHAGAASGRPTKVTHATRAERKRPWTIAGGGSAGSVTGSAYRPGSPVRIKPGAESDTLWARPIAEGVQMYWFFTDETNLEPNQGTFFMYGGLIMTPEQIRLVDESLERIRAEYGYGATDSFKFQTSSRPRHITQDKWTASKLAALEEAARIGVEMIVYIVHHKIAAEPDKRIEYALNSVLDHFDSHYLGEKNDVGAVCVDRLDPKFGYKYLRQRFQAPQDVRRIIHYSMSCDGASHVSSLVDIALGSFRYSANTAMGSGSDQVAHKLFPWVSRLMWQKRVGKHIQIRGYGFLQFPRLIKVPSYKAEYDQLRSKLANYITD
jgi:hypothetical protein